MIRQRGTIRHKLDRIRSGARPRLLDLFGGCGGMSLGFEAAGFHPIAAIEKDPDAAASYAWNFHRLPDGTPDPFYATPRDIDKTDPRTFVGELEPEMEPAMAVDVIVGGPPCQAYARVGRAKLRQVMGRPDAYRVDDRGHLFRELLEWVEQLQPIAVVMENVPDMLNYGGDNLARVVCEALERLGYVARYGLINAVHYGVPQMRERLFVVALAAEVEQLPVLPVPSTEFELPYGYLCVKRLRGGRVPKGDPYRIEPVGAAVRLRPAVTTREAIGDLPVLRDHLQSDRRIGPAIMDSLLPYRADVEPSRYARLMRTWPSHTSPGAVVGHVTRSLPRDYPIFRRMPQGSEYPEAHRIAHELLEERLADIRALGAPCNPGSFCHGELTARMVPPYDPSKFPNKWWKLDPDKPVRTLTAHIGKDTYSHIHFDGGQARTITVREAARLQSFPDGFRFRGRMNSVFRQIGNAVPPLLAYAVARSLRSQLRMNIRTTVHTGDRA